MSNVHDNNECSITDTSQDMTKVEVVKDYPKVV